MQPQSSTNQFFGVRVSKTGVPVNAATDKQLVYKDDFSTKTYYDNTNSRIVEGLLPDSTYGMWVSKPGIDVTTAAADQLIFNSNQDIFKIVDKFVSDPFTVTSSVTVITNTVTIAHNLGYVPLVLCSVTLTTNTLSGSSPGTYALPFLSLGIDTYTLTDFNIICCIQLLKITSTNMTFGVALGAGPLTVAGSFTAYVLQETAK